MTRQLEFAMMIDKKQPHNCDLCSGEIDMKGKFMIIVNKNTASFVHWGCLMDGVTDMFEEVNREHSLENLR